MEPTTIRFMVFKSQKDKDWMKSQVYELASKAQVVVAGVYEKEVPQKVDYLSMFGQTKQRTEVYYVYNVDVIGPGLNIEKFEHLVEGFNVGYNSHHVQREAL